MAFGGINLGQELLNVPMGEMIRSMATSIADAQWSLDKSSMTVAEMMSGRRVLRDLDTGKLIGANGQTTDKVQVLDSRVFFGYSIDLDEEGNPFRRPQLLSMMELGFTPTFYQFVDTIIEVRISISIKSETTTTTENISQTDVTTDGYKTNSSNSSRNSSSSSGYSYRGYNWGWGWGGRRSSSSSSSSSSSRSSSYGTEKKKTVSTSQVNASYSKKYGYSAEGASILRTKLVPVPPPAILEERIHEIMRIEGAYEQWNLLNLMRSKLEKERDAAQESNDTDTVAQKNELIEDVDLRLKDTLANLIGAEPS